MTILIDGQSLWLAETNCYVVAPDTGGPCVVIDSPPDLQGVADLLAAHDLYPAALLVTHAHIDHAGGAGGFISKWPVRAYLHPDDEWLAADPAEQLRTLFGGMLPGWMDTSVFAPPETWAPLEDDESLELAGIQLRVLHTPGHTPGHCCFYLEAEETLFAGDQLFAGSIGRTDLPGGDYERLMESMAAKVVTLPGPTRVLPGHGPATTISHEQRTNPFLSAL
jgi:hydroxyacylglutathione hydrolase